MEKFTVDGIIAQVYFDDRRAKKVPKQENEKDIVLMDLRYPVKYRIFYNGRYFFHSSKIDLTQEEWSVLSTSKKREIIDTRELIQAGFDRIKEIIKELVKGEGFSLEALNRRLSKGQKNDVLTAFYEKIEDLTKTGQIGTASTYQCAIKSIMEFTGEGLKFSDITVDWLKRYEAHLLKEVTVKGKTKKKSITTVKFYVGCIRALMNDARKDKIITEGQYPFGTAKEGKYQIKSGEGRKIALTLAQIKAVLDYDLTTSTEKRCRDLWFFSYLCNGINVNDMLKLKYKDKFGGEIHFHRQKTMRTTMKQKEIAATLLPEMEEIIKKWGNPEKPDNYIFPFLNGIKDPVAQKRVIQNVTRLINKKMLLISDGLKFDHPISTYTARHSFATVLKRSGSNIAFISESLGHSDIRTTAAYLASFEQEERAKNASKLTQF